MPVQAKKQARDDRLRLKSNRTSRAAQDWNLELDA